MEGEMIHYLSGISLYRASTSPCSLAAPPPISIPSAPGPIDSHISTSTSPSPSHSTYPDDEDGVVSPYSDLSSNSSAAAVRAIAHEGINQGKPKDWYNLWVHLSTRTLYYTLTTWQLLNRSLALKFQTTPPRSLTQWHPGGREWRLELYIKKVRNNFLFNIRAKTHNLMYHRSRNIQFAPTPPRSLNCTSEVTNEDWRYM